MHNQPAAKPQNISFFLGLTTTGIVVTALQPGTASPLFSPPSQYSTGKMALEPQVEQTLLFYEGLAAVKINNKWGYINSSRNLVIKSQFDGADDFSEGLAAVKIGNKWGYIDKNGQIIIKPQFEDADDFNKGLAAVKIDDQWGYINKTGQIIIKPGF